jgi:hypothetical protein
VTTGALEHLGGDWEPTVEATRADIAGVVAAIVELAS